MPSMNMVQALNSAMDVMLSRDSRVVVLGEDVGYFGGVFRVTDGLQKKHGAHRVLDTPIAEGGIVGAAVGMCVNGLRPVAEIQFADYIYPAYDQIVSEVGHDGKRFPTASNRCLPQRHGVIALRHFGERMTRPRLRGLVRLPIERTIVDALGLEKDDRIIVFNGRDQHALGIVGI